MNTDIDSITSLGIDIESVKSFSIETEITVSISEDNDFIAIASFDESDKTVLLRYYYIDSNCNGSVKINLKKVPINGKINMTISKLIPPNYVRFRNKVDRIISKVFSWTGEGFFSLPFHIFKKINKPISESRSNSKYIRFIILSCLCKENYSDEAEAVENKNKSVFIFLSLESDSATNRTVNIQHETVSDEAQVVLGKLDAVSINLQPENVSNETKVEFVVLPNDEGQSQFEEGILMDVKNKEFISAEFLADGETLAIQYDDAIQYLSVEFWPWKLFYKQRLCDGTKATFAFNRTEHKSYVLLPWHGGKFIDIYEVGIFTLSHISNIIEEKSCVGKNAIVSSTGNLLAFENGPIVERHTGLHIAEHNVISDKKDLLFVNDNRHLLIIYFDETLLEIKLKLLDSYSGIELDSETILDKLESGQLKHIQLIKDDIIAVISNNETTIKKWRWEDVFCSQSEESRLIEEIDFSVSDIDSLEVSIAGFDIKDDVTSDCLFLFWKDSEDNSHLRCLVWKPSTSLSRPFQYLYQNSILRIYSDDKKFCTSLPLDLVKEGKNLSAEWMQSSCKYYFNNSKRSSSISEILLNTIKRYVDHKVFNGTTAVGDLIESNSIDADAIVENILDEKHYIPTGIHSENILVKVIKRKKKGCQNISLVWKILEYCLNCYFRENEPGFMSIVVDALPQLAIHYPQILSIFLDQCTNMKVPSKWNIDLDEKVESNHSNLYGCEFNCFTKAESLKSNFYSFYEKKYSHSATYCHVPLYNLFNKPNRDKFFPKFDDFSPFTKLTLLRPLEVFESPLFEAVIMYIWHNYKYEGDNITLLYLLILFYYMAYFCLFVAANSIVSSNPFASFLLMIISMFNGGVWAYFWFRRTFVSIATCIEFKTNSNLLSIFIESAALILPFVSGFLYILRGNAPPELQSLSILFLWVYIFFQFRAFEGIGIFIAVLKNTLWKIKWLLLILIFILLSFSHTLLVLLSDTLPDNGSNTFTGFYQSFKNTWSMLLNNYDSLRPWTQNYMLDIFMIVFSLSTAIIMFNILIALINDSYKETYKKARTIWIMELATMIADIEIFFSNNRFNNKLEEDKISKEYIKIFTEIANEIKMINEEIMKNQEMEQESISVKKIDYQQNYWH
ncbi:4563_t:CDS:2 [Acaulospora morrowiae]|uniref:4563_t:CDS:1 n=1 Tax=Acaulospora morrowiae TaxID=94023 RepID=A0A9N8Z2T7_9GLOM|nr:4563_t:CDS:2 [Acaulospora morrowiae]